MVVTARRLLAGGPNVVQMVPLTRTVRDSSLEVLVEPDRGNGLGAPSAAQCQHVRSVATSRILGRSGNVGPLVLAEIREILSLLMDL